MLRHYVFTLTVPRYQDGVVLREQLVLARIPTYSTKAPNCLGATLDFMSMQRRPGRPRAGGGAGNYRYSLPGTDYQVVPIKPLAPQN